jgi:hypothetical protein
LFLGFYKVGLKKRFSWNRINKIYCECDYSFIFYRRTALCLQEKKLVRIGYIGSIFAKEYELSFLESALNFLFKEKYKVSGGI